MRKFLRKLTPHPFDNLLTEFRKVSVLLGEVLAEQKLSTAALERLTQEIQVMAKQSASVADALAQLQADVAAETTVEQSAVTLIQGIPALIQNAIATASAAGATPDQLAAFDTLASQIESNSTTLSAAVTANTPGTAPAPGQPGSGT